MSKESAALPLAHPHYTASYTTALNESLVSAASTASTQPLVQVV